MALWCYLLSNWDINNLKVNSALSGVELQRAQKMLAAAKDIYARGTAWNEVLSPEVTCTPDRDTAYEVTIDGKQYNSRFLHSGQKPGCVIMQLRFPLLTPVLFPGAPVSWI